MLPVQLVTEPITVKSPVTSKLLTSPTISNPPPADSGMLVGVFVESPVTVVFPVVSVEVDVIAQTSDAPV